MTTLRTVVQGTTLMLAAEANGKLHMLHPQGRVGDCIRPGQRSTRPEHNAVAPSKG